MPKRELGPPAEKLPECWPDVHKTPPHVKVLSAMTMEFVHELVDALDGARQWTEPGREMPEGVTWANVVQSTAALTYAAVTSCHLGEVERRDGTKVRPPAKVGDVLLAANPHTLPPPYRDAREYIRRWLFETPWPDEGAGYDDVRSGKWLLRTLHLIRDLRAIYVEEGMRRYEKSGRKAGRDRMVKERIAQVEEAQKSPGQRAAESVDALVQAVTSED